MCLVLAYRKIIHPEPLKHHHNPTKMDELTPPETPRRVSDISRRDHPAPAPLHC